MLFQRILTVVIAAPFLIGAILVPSPVVFKSVVFFCLLIGLLEFFTIIGLKKSERFFALFLGLFHMGYLLFCPSLYRHNFFEVTVLLFLVFTFYCLWPLQNIEGVGGRMALTLLGTLYIGTFGSYVGLMRELPYGVYWVFTVLAMTWMNDTFAYFFGHHFGRHRLAPLISPGKTLEGLAGGYLGSAVGFLGFWFGLTNPVSLGQGLWLTLLVGTVGPLGDLSESLIKRSFHIKDSGNIIPGHGGMMDRIDALLFTAPVVYFFAMRLGQG